MKKITIYGHQTLEFRNVISFHDGQRELLGRDNKLGEVFMRFSYIANDKKVKNVTFYLDGIGYCVEEQEE